jgi:hypothetical protein
VLQMPVHIFKPFCTATTRYRFWSALDATAGFAGSDIGQYCFVPGF